MRRIYHASVWAPTGVSAKDWRFRGLFRFVLPATDLLFLYFGAVGWVNGVATVQDAAGSDWQTWWSAGITLAAFAAFVGVAFPRLWPVELLGKIFLIALVAVFVALSAVRIVTDFHTSATAGLVIILILLPIWRVGDLGFVAWQRGHRAGPGS